MKFKLVINVKTSPLLTTHSDYFDGLVRITVVKTACTIFQKAIENVFRGDIKI